MITFREARRRASSFVGFVEPEVKDASAKLIASIQDIKTREEFSCDAEIARATEKIIQLNEAKANLISENMDEGITLDEVNNHFEIYREQLRVVGILEEIEDLNAQIREAENIATRADPYALYLAAEIAKLCELGLGQDILQYAGQGELPLIVAAERGLVEIVDLLLMPSQDQALLVNKTVAREGGRSALYAAAENGHIDVVRTLLEVEGVDVNKSYVNIEEGFAFNPLMIALENDQLDLAKQLVRSGARLNDEQACNELYSGFPPSRGGGAQLSYLELLTARFSESIREAENPEELQPVKAMQALAESGHFSVSDLMGSCFITEANDLLSELKQTRNQELRASVAGGNARLSMVEGKQETKEEPQINFIKSFIKDLAASCQRPEEQSFELGHGGGGGGGTPPTSRERSRQSPVTTLGASQSYRDELAQEEELDERGAAER
jgi:hypothetical protein